MTRPLPEWIGRTDETPLPPRVKARIIERQDGICACGCGQPFTAKDPAEFDHVLALILGGENRETNMQGLRPGCHRSKTTADVAVKSRDQRKSKKHLGIAPRSRCPLPGGKASRWKRTVGGRVVPREEP